jgi:hypothetical protein
MPLELALYQQLQLWSKRAASCSSNSNYRVHLFSVSEVWTSSLANEFGHLAQGLGGCIEATNPIYFIPYSKIPRDWIHRMGKENPCRTKLTVRGDKINYPGELGTPKCKLLLAKIFFKSVISTPHVQFLTTDISNFYLNSTPMTRK